MTKHAEHKHLSLLVYLGVLFVVTGLILIGIKSSSTPKLEIRDDAYFYSLTSLVERNNQAMGSLLGQSSGAPISKQCLYGEDGGIGISIGDIKELVCTIKLDMFITDQSVVTQNREQLIDDAKQLFLKEGFQIRDPAQLNPPGTGRTTLTWASTHDSYHEGCFASLDFLGNYDGYGHDELEYYVNCIAGAQDIPRGFTYSHKTIDI